MLQGSPGIHHGFTHAPVVSLSLAHPVIFGHDLFFGLMMLLLSGVERNFFISPQENSHSGEFIINVQNKHV